MRAVALACCLAAALAAPAIGTSNRASPVVVRLGPHVFGHTRKADARVVDARWGQRPGEIGLGQVERGPVGGSSFDVDRSGTVDVLDQVNSRVVAFGASGGNARIFPLRVGGVFTEVESDLAVGTDGTIYVLETKNAIQNRWQTMFSFPPLGGRPVASALTAGESVRTNGTAAIVSFADHWRSLMNAGRPAPGAWLPYRPLPDGTRLAVRPDASHGVVRVALTGRNGARAEWVVHSPTSFALYEVAAVGSNVVLVLVVSDGKHDEFDAVEVGLHGLVRRFSGKRQEYAEAVLDGSFRVVGSSLYYRGSTESGLYVDRYSLAP